MTSAKLHGIWRIAAIGYRVLLALYPPKFRRSFANEMADAFDARLLAGRATGLLAPSRFCVLNYVDLLRTAAAEWLGRSRSRKYRSRGYEQPSIPRRRWLADARLDARYAWRSLVKRPGYALVIVGMLALAIGANSAIFSALQAVLFNPLPFRDADRVVVLGELAPALDTQFVSPITYDDWNARNDAFGELAAFRYWQTVNLEDTTGDPESINLVTATANFFPALGLSPLIGRSYKDEQNKAGGSEAVISHDLWERRYHGDPAILGKAIRVRGTTTTIVGVLPPASLDLSVGWGDVWTCLYRYNVQQQRATSYRARYLSVVGRLKPGMSLEQARARMTTLQHQLWREPASVAAGYEVRLQSIADALTGRVRLGVVVLFGASGLVLLIACANIANLMLARAAAREQETAVRLALGAGASQLLRLLLIEALTLAGLGAGVGLVAAYASLTILRQAHPDIPRIADAALTPSVLVFTAGITLLVALVFGLAPLVHLRNATLGSSINDSARGSSAGLGRRRVRTFLVACQMALACALLIAGGLMFRSLRNLLSVDPGFRARSAVVFDLYLPSSRYPDDASQTRFYRELMRSLEEAPGVLSAGGLLYFPLRPKLWLSSVWVQDAPVADGDEPVVYYNLATPGYFQAMGIPLKAGRWPDAREAWEQPRAVVVNEAFAADVLRGRALGRRIRGDRENPWYEVVGVVGNVRQKRLDEPSKPEMYETFSAMPMPFLSVVVRTARPAAQMLEVVRAVVRERDPGLAVANLMPLADYLAAHTADRRFALLLLEAFAILAVALGTTGVYSVMSYSIAQRRREIAIRLALGAEPAGVLVMVVRDALRVVLAGTVVGMAAAAVAGRLMRGFLFGVGGLDPVIYVGVPCALALVAVLASWIPARRAACIDAIGSLRAD
jgi:putative ABC transport system permease protein